MSTTLRFWVITWSLNVSTCSFMFSKSVEKIYKNTTSSITYIQVHIHVCYKRCRFLHVHVYIHVFAVTRIQSDCHVNIRKNRNYALSYSEPSFQRHILRKVTIYLPDLQSWLIQYRIQIVISTTSLAPSTS